MTVQQYFLKSVIDKNENFFEVKTIFLYDGIIGGLLFITNKASKNIDLDYKLFCKINILKLQFCCGVT